MIRNLKTALSALLLSVTLFSGLLTALPFAAQAQSNPGLVYGQVPTAAQWNSYFAAKQDTLLVPANSLLGNNTGAGTAVRYITMPSGCVAANNALIWVPNVGWTCNTITASGTVNPGTANYIGYYAASGSAISALATINSGVLQTNSSGVPSFSLTLPASVQANITQLSTIVSGAWNGSTIGVAYGGTGLTSYTSGGIPYASASGTLASSGVLGANGVVIGGGAGTTPATIATANNGTLITSAGGVPSISATLPAAVQGNITATGTLTTGSTGAGYTVAVGTSTITGVLPAANGGAGAVTGALKANGSGLVTQAACADLSNGATGCSTATGTSGATIPLLNAANTWSGIQSYTVNDFVLKGSSSGNLTLNAASVAGTTTIVLPGGSTDFSSTGGTSQVVKQTSTGAAFTVARLACADLSDSGTGCTSTPGTAAAANTGTSGHVLGFLDGANTWSAVQSINSGDLALKGASSGTITLNAPTAAGSNTITLPAGTTDFSGTGGSSQVVKQTSSGGAFTVAQLACSDLSNATTACSTSIGTSGATIPLLSTANTWTTIQTFNAGLVGAPSITLGDATTGLYRVSSGQIGITSGGVLQGTWLSTGLTMNANTLTFGDGATWSATGLADTATYTTSSTSPFILSPTWNFSSTSNGISALTISPTLTPTGASAGNVAGVSVQSNLGIASVNQSDLRNLNVGFTIGAGYSGTLANAESIRVFAPTNNGSNPITTLRQISVDGSTNGNAITSGTVTNLGLIVNAHTAAAGSGGTLVNTGVQITVPSGSSAGNTDRALWITGNGGLASTKYALYSDSTAASLLSGILQLPAGTVSAPSLNLGDATSGLYRTGSNAIAVTLNSAQVLGLTTSGAAVTGTLGSTGTASLGTGSTDYVTASGGSTGGTLATNGGTLSLAPAATGVLVTGSAIANTIYNDTSRSTDLKNWIVGADGNSGFQIKAENDALGAVTAAYVVARGTTYNVASHTWSTSTVAGTPVQKMQITATAQTIVNPLSLSGGLSVGGTAGTGGVAVASAISANTASSINVDYSSGGRIIVQGADGSTNGVLSLISQRSDASNSLTLLSSDTSGTLTSAQAVTLSNTTIKLTGVTTGTNADFLCRASDGTVLLQTSACTISTRALKIDLGKAPFDPAVALRKIDVAYFRYKDGAVSSGDVVNAGNPETGLYAEDVAAAIPGSAVYWEDGKTVKSYRQPAVLAALVGGWNSHDGDIRKLKAANDDLRAANENLTRRVQALEARR